MRRARSGRRSSRSSTRRTRGARRAGAAGADPSLRHEFGAEPWALPEEVVGPGAPWHVRGSLLGLERALARLSLHRLAGDALPEAPPVIDAGQRRSLAMPAASSTRCELCDADRDAIAAAVEAGRSRAAALRAGQAERGRGVPRGGPRPVARARLRVAARARAGRARAASSPWASSCTSARAASGASTPGAYPTTSPRGLVPRLPARVPLDEQRRDGRRSRRSRRASWTWSCAWRSTSRERRLPRASALRSCRRSFRTCSPRPGPWRSDDRLGLDAWVRAQGRDRLDDAVASLVGRGPLQPASAPGGSR